MVIEKDIEYTKKSIQSFDALIKEHVFLKMNIWWGLNIALLSGSFFLFLNSLLNYSIGDFWKIILLNILFLGLFIDFILTSIKHDYSLKKFQNMKKFAVERLSSLQKIKDNSKLTEIYNKVFNKNH